LNPFKRYVNGEIEASVTGDIEKSNSGAREITGTGAEESTIRRWVRQFNRRLPLILQVLEMILLKECSEMLSLLSQEMGWKRMLALLRLFPPLKASSLMGWCNQKLFLCDFGIFF
jgi:hypothetical protein